MKRVEESLEQESAIGLSIEDYIKELDKADAEIEAGEYITHEEVKKDFTKRQFRMAQYIELSR